MSSARFTGSTWVDAAQLDAQGQAFAGQHVQFTLPAGAKALVRVTSKANLTPRTPPISSAVDLEIFASEVWTSMGSMQLGEESVVDGGAEGATYRVTCHMYGGDANEDPPSPETSWRVDYGFTQEPFEQQS
jgi:hypothetical protein